jgi:hypothetical protein
MKSDSNKLPAREQIDAARHLVTDYKDSAYTPAELDDALTTLIAATAKPTDDGLAREAARVSERVTRGADTVLDAYIAGARREGVQ